MNARDLLASTSLAAFIAARPPSTVVSVSSSDKLDKVWTKSFEKSERFESRFSICFLSFDPSQFNLDLDLDPSSLSPLGPPPLRLT